jgi:polar amino acid transport system substrate-binding protein
MRWTQLLLAALAALAAPARAHEVPATLKACDDASGYPPFPYVQQRLENGHEVVAGYSIDYLDELGRRSGHPVTIEATTWRRCMGLVAEGSIDIALDAAWNAERARTYVTTQPYYELTPVLVYDRARPPPAVATEADLRKLRLCGLDGYTYSYLGLPDELIDRGARTMELAAAKLVAGHCDVFVSSAEVQIGARLMSGHTAFPADQFGFTRPDYVATIPVHMLIGRALPYHEELARFLARWIADMEESGTGARLMARYRAQN